MNNKVSIDISENEILGYGEELLSILLFDRTTQHNIIWATSDYEEYGNEYQANFPITIQSITGKNRNIIQPRICKKISNQNNRTKSKAEVFTPSWVCNEQNNLIDVDWFGREGVFNIQKHKNWVVNTDRIHFCDKMGKRWTDYIDAKRLEISCGEAPYLVSRYDTVSGEFIPIERRIGLLDRKLRVASENTDTYEDWIKWSKRAFESIYGFEFQGDNLLLARENLLYTFIDFYKDKFHKKPSIDELEPIAYIISWNLWQMDGLNNTVPYTNNIKKYQQLSIFDSVSNSATKPCYCKIRDWRANKTITFASLRENIGG